MAIADMVSRFTSAMSTFGMLALLLNLPSFLIGGQAGMPWAGVLLLMAAPSIGATLQLALSRTREYDADLGAAMLTGDPDGLASALLKLERAQRRNWEGMVLPGGRVPDPSILRSHPRTRDRIDRLMALKRDASMPAETLDWRGDGQPRPSRPSVPSIRPNWGRGEEARYVGYAALLDANAQASVVTQGEGDRAASGKSLNPPLGKPRIRISRGGVYW
jgi:heat shock protein HtpX